ncbi:heterokaryon incompatibility protein-domain-containing protein, partial [Ampelomyces quisqualis]
MEPSTSMCQALNTYLEKHSGHPDLRFAVSIGSIAESERCGCRYCYVACQTVGQNQTHDNEAMRMNWRRDIGPGFGPTKNGRISGMFMDSGLCLESCGHQREIFFYDSQDVKLIETEGRRGCYVCLSHCWGGEQPLKTTLDPDTLTQYEQRIEWDLLPKTFQDAITFSRFFGAQYIWIDSLCIIQDSLNDWRAQSALMVEIYQNAAITIAGSASSSPHQGLFRTAKSGHIDEPLIGTESLEGIDKIRSREPLSHDAAELPLMQRGWVFQERLLSPRYLHFGQNELIWECMERLTCECGTLHLQQESFRTKWLEPKNRLHPDSLQYLLKNKPYSIPRAWRAAVVDYSRMKLSHPEDLFLSISGIAKCVQEATGWQYVAGMWKETLITDLL